MAVVTHVDVSGGDVMLLLGTAKGAFVLRSSARRDEWQVGGPYFAGHKIYSVAYDGRGGRTRLWAGAFNNHWGCVLAHSDDFGRAWHVPERANVVFPEGSGEALKQIWEIRPAPGETGDVMYCGVEPAALFESRDAGESWEIVRGLFEHPQRKAWQPGGGGLCLHTIVPDPTDPRRTYVAISTGGVYRTEDGGATWRPRNKGISTRFLPGEPPEFGQCVHRAVICPTNPRRLYVQNHWGLYRSDDGADTWTDIGEGFPWTFGFPMAVDPHDADTAYILPLESDEVRLTPEGRLRVWRTRDAGASWQESANGLPAERAMDVVLRHGMDTDRLRPAGVYFGTQSGKVYGSIDGGESWRLVAGGLPPVLCVRAARV